MQLQAIVSISEMARMVGLSRQRYFQLQGSTFPNPLRDERGRPYYDEELQQICLDVRQKNCGVDGKPVLFYARRTDLGTTRKRTAKPKKPTQHSFLIDGLRSLGLNSLTTEQVEKSLKGVFPDGVNGTDQGEVIRGVFLNLKRKEPV